jgi:glycosyltransferase involved in cell wall biosynthesis
MARWHAMNWSRYHSLLYALADAGHEIHVMQPPPLKSAETNFQEIASCSHRNIIIHDVPLTSWLWNLRMPLEKLFKKAYYSFTCYRDAKRLIAEHGINVVLLYNIPQYRFISLDSVVLVFDYADDYIDMLAYELGRLNIRPLRNLAQRLLNNMMSRATLTFSISNILAQQALGNVHVLPNGVNLAKASALPSTPIEPVHHAGRPVVGFIGSFEYFIDLDLMLEVAKAMPDILFLFVGTGREWKRVEKRIRDENIRNIQLTGGVPHDQVFEYIRAMDICLNLFTKMPVSHRACPIKLFEYLSQMKPVITTRLDELEYIDDGFLYYGDTVVEVLAQIRAILNDRAAAEVAARRGYLKTVNHYTWDRIAERFAVLATDKLPRIA